MINVAYYHKMIEDYFGDGSRWGVSIGYAFEGEYDHGDIVPKPKGSAGGMKAIQDFSGFFDETTLVICGDAIIDEGVNIGAGTIFANYDGTHKSTSHVGRDAFVGSNSVIVSPVDIGAGALIAAGSAVTEDVPPGALCIARGRQRNVEDWMAERRPGSKWADAAAQSDGTVHPAVTESREKKA